MLCAEGKFTCSNYHHLQLSHHKLLHIKQAMIPLTRDLQVFPTVLYTMIHAEMEDSKLFTNIAVSCAF